MADPIRDVLERAARELELVAGSLTQAGWAAAASRARDEAHAARAALAAQPPAPPPASDGEREELAEMLIQEAGSLEARCIKIFTGECRTGACLQRGGYVRSDGPPDSSVATCPELEKAGAKRRAATLLRNPAPAAVPADLTPTRYLHSSGATIERTRTEPEAWAVRRGSERMSTWGQWSIEHQGRHLAAMGGAETVVVLDLAAEHSFSSPQAALEVLRKPPQGGDVEPAATPDTRNPECVTAWPDCYDGGFDPRCCRFPKSCSCEVRQPPQPPAPATDSDGELKKLVEWLYASALEWSKLGKYEEGSKCERTADLLKRSEFSTDRLYRLQQENHRFSEPGRTILCDILANGCLLPDPEGKRYGQPPAPAAVPADLTPTRYYHSASGATIERTRWEPDAWAVRISSERMSILGQWSIEPSPSERTAEYLAQHSFSSPHAALAVLQQQKPPQGGEVEQ
jgi:hypothetical protein